MTQLENSISHSAQQVSLLLVAFLVLVLFPASALARGGIEITPYAGYRFGGEFEDGDSGEKLKLEDAPAWGLAVDFDYGKNGQIGFLYSHQSTKFRDENILPDNTQLDIDFDYLQFNSTYLFDGTHTRPYIAGGLGMAYLKPDYPGFNSTTRFSFSLGGGLKWYANKNLGIRFDVRGFGTILESGTAVFCANGACNIHVTGGGVFQLETSLGVIFRF